MVPDRLTLRSLARATPGSAHYLYPRKTTIYASAQASARMSEQGIEPAENRRKPGGQCLAACPPGLTADTTVFSIDGPAQMRPGRGGGGGEKGGRGGGRCLGSVPRGLTADTTVFAIDGPAQMRLRRAGRQGIASRGVPCKRHLQPLALPAFGGRFGFVRRGLQSCRPSAP